jgi:hypothetical protein
MPPVMNPEAAHAGAMYVAAGSKMAPEPTTAQFVVFQPSLSA